MVIDYFSRYLEVANLSSTTTAHIKDKLESIFIRHGVLEMVVMDNGSQFTATEFTGFPRGPAAPSILKVTRRPKGLCKWWNWGRSHEEPHKPLQSYSITLHLADAFIQSDWPNAYEYFGDKKIAMQEYPMN